MEASAPSKMSFEPLERSGEWNVVEWSGVAVAIHPSREIVLKFGSNMGQKSILNHIFDPF